MCVVRNTDYKFIYRWKVAVADSCLAFRLGAGESVAGDDNDGAIRSHDDALIAAGQIGVTVCRGTAGDGQPTAKTTS